MNLENKPNTMRSSAAAANATFFLSFFAANSFGSLFFHSPTTPTTTATATATTKSYLFCTDPKTWPTDENRLLCSKVFPLWAVYQHKTNWPRDTFWRRSSEVIASRIGSELSKLGWRPCTCLCNSAAKLVFESFLCCAVQGLLLCMSFTRSTPRGFSSEKSLD